MPHLLIPALAGEPHADPEPALPMEARNTEEEFANIFARFALLALSMHLTPAGPNAFELSVRSGHVFPGAGGLVGVGRRHGCPAGGVRGVPGGLRGGRHGQDTAVLARLPRALHPPLARRQPPLPALPLRHAGRGGAGGGR